VSFNEAEKVFDDPSAIYLYDEEYSTPEKARMIAIGVSNISRIIVVGHYVDLKGRIEVFRARKATRKEWARYGQR
jgi:uncharacterized DUF497 family protein